MRARLDPLGKLLQRSGALTEEELSDVLRHQQRPLPFASLCYVLGYADEEVLVRALARQCGMPGIVLDQSIIRLRALDGVPSDLALLRNVLPVFEDERRLFVAVENLASVEDVLRELEFIKGKVVLPHVALHITLARAVRACLAAFGNGDSYWMGPLADSTHASPGGAMMVISDVDQIPESSPEARAHEAVIEDVTKELVDSDLILIGSGDPDDVEPSTTEQQLADRGGDGVDQGQAATTERNTEPSLSSVELQPLSENEIDLDGGQSSRYDGKHEGPPRVLIVDDDFATRHLLVKELQPLGYVTSTASTGGEAVRLIQIDPPDLVVIDVMLPEIDGFQICRAIKRSKRYSDIPVILMSAVIDSGRVTDEVLRRYGADAYFEKPLNTERIQRRIRDLVGARESRVTEPEDDGFDNAMDLYRAGRVDAAVEVLKGGLEVDPLSAKHHFVLANLLQKQTKIYEAIDEYEATVDLKPDYFPALTRLAYLYYKKGFSAKAIETWRRSLPYCPDPALRQNIEVFMRKLIADMQSEV